MTRMLRSISARKAAVLRADVFLRARRRDRLEPDAAGGGPTPLPGGWLLPAYGLPRAARQPETTSVAPTPTGITHHALRPR